MIVYKWVFILIFKRILHRFKNFHRFWKNDHLTPLIPSLLTLPRVSGFCSLFICLVLSPFRSSSCLICLVRWFLCFQMWCINISTFFPTWSNTDNLENWISNVDPYSPLKNTRYKAEKPQWCRYLSFPKGLISKSKIYF